MSDCKECGRELLGSSEQDLGVCNACEGGNTPKTVEDLKQQVVAKLKRAYFNGTTDVIARKNGVIPNDTKLGEYQIELLADELITALNELKSELTKQQVVSALQQTALDHIVGGDYEDLLTKNLNAELRAEERLQK